LTKKKKLPLTGIQVLTTDPEKRIGLYAIRYLGRAGAIITSIAQKSGSSKPMGFYSRYVQSKKYIGEANFFDELSKFLVRRSRRYHIINPIDISKMLCVLDTDKKFNLNCNYLLPKRNSLVIADNKELLTKHAQEIGLRCPKTLFRINPEDIKDFCRSKELTYPCIIKFRGDKRETHWNPEERYTIVSSPDMLSSEYLRMHEIEEFPVVQEYIYGRGFGYFALFDKKNNLKAQFCHKRIREYPNAGGPSSCCESFYDPELVSIGRRLFESLEWSGLGMVEFKYDKMRKQYFIIEVNPRYWGSLPLAVFSGVNFPVLHALSAIDVDYEPILNYRLGLKVRFFDKDVKSILNEIRLEKNLRRKVSLFLEIFNPTIRDGFIALDDIRPFLQSAINGIKRTF
jgi:predicted ATP-grasp superfamily ATP-dependent carboligase